MGTSSTTDWRTTLIISRISISWIRAYRSPRSPSQCADDRTSRPFIYTFSPAPSCSAVMLSAYRIVRPALYYATEPASRSPISPSSSLVSSTTTSSQARLCSRLRARQVRRNLLRCDLRHAYLPGSSALPWCLRQSSVECKKTPSAYLFNPDESLHRAYWSLTSPDACADNRAPQAPCSASPSPSLGCTTVCVAPSSTPPLQHHCNTTSAGTRSRQDRIQCSLNSAPSYQTNTPWLPPRCHLRSTVPPMSPAHQQGIRAPPFE